ncbi:MAG: hypothetical protein BWX90_01131 [bacterium ADurb.Bin132]|nr:MAG: hypothetical protein BWX90_01131 [bacterium ADurb.Bin132]
MESKSAPAKISFWDIARPLTRSVQLCSSLPLMTTLVSPMTLVAFNFERSGGVVSFVILVEAEAVPPSKDCAKTVRVFSPSLSWAINSNFPFSPGSTV